MARCCTRRADGTFTDVTAPLSAVVAGAADPVRRRWSMSITTAISTSDRGGPGPSSCCATTGTAPSPTSPPRPGLPPPARAVAIVPTDFDNRRDIDLLMATGRAPSRSSSNMRDGTFQDVAAQTGLPRGAGLHRAWRRPTSTRTATPISFFGRGRRPRRVRDERRTGPFRGALTARRDRRVRPPRSSSTTTTTGCSICSSSRPAGAEAVPQCRRRMDRRDRARQARCAARQTFRSLALRRLDGDGDTDIVARLADRRGARVAQRRGQRAGRRCASCWPPASATAAAPGAKIEIRAGQPARPARICVGDAGVRAGRPASSASGRAHSGGRRARAVAVRASCRRETAPSPRQAAGMTHRRSSIASPRPARILYTWNGSAVRVRDRLSGRRRDGRLGRPGDWNTPDPDEYVRIRGDQLRPRNGRYELRITNELEEAMFLDRLQPGCRRSSRGRRGLSE